MNRSGMVPEVGRRRFGKIGRVGGQVGRVEPEKRAVAQLERRLETGIQFEVGRWNEGHPSIAAGPDDLEVKRLRGSRSVGARNRRAEKRGDERGSHSASSPLIRPSHSS
jgi:hypothetical protein